MMLEPSIDSLLEKIDSKYSMVILASKRAHELESGMTPLLDHYSSVKNVGRALEEIDAGVVTIHPDPDMKRRIENQRREEEKMTREKEKQAMEEKIQQEQKDFKS